MLVAGPKARDNDRTAGAPLKRMVVPLDGSPLAETALPHVEELASRLSLEVVLARVVSTPNLGYWDGVPVPTFPVEEYLTSEAEQYLDAVAWRFRNKRIRARWKVMKEGPAAIRISDYARGQDGTMVAISTRGRSGLGRLLVGSVADALIRSLDTPVLVVRPSG